MEGSGNVNGNNDGDNNGNNNGNGNDNNGNGNGAMMIEDIGSELELITDAVRQNRIDNNLCSKIWQLMTTFSHQSGRRVPDLIVQALEEGIADRDLDLDEILDQIINAFNNFFQNQNLQLNQLPFFPANLIQPQNENRQQMSGRMASLTNYATVKTLYHRFNTTFVALDPDLSEVEVRDGGNLRTTFRGVFESSLNNVIGRREGDIGNKNSQMFALEACIERLLRRFNIKMKVTGNSDPDVEVQLRRTETTTLFIGESKSNEKLPSVPITAQLSKQLLDQGFATALSTAKYRSTRATRHLETELDWNRLATNLRSTVNLPTGHLSTLELPSIQLSQRARDILRNEDEELHQSYDAVIEAFQSNRIHDMHALHLWGATMQACAKCIELKMKYAMVLSDNAVWFIRLVDHNYVDNEDNRPCRIGISKSFAVGSSSFIEDFVRFATMVGGSADIEKNMTDDKQTNWLRKVPESISAEVGSDLESGGVGGGGGGSGGAHENEGNRDNPNHRDDHISQEEEEEEDSHGVDGDEGRSEVLSHQHKKMKWKSDEGRPVLESGTIKTHDMSDIESETCPSSSASSTGSKRSSRGSPSSNDTSTEYILFDDMNDHNQNGNADRPHSKDEHDVCGSKKAVTVDSYSSSTMTDQEQMMWQRALWSPACRNARTTKKDLRRGINLKSDQTAGTTQSPKRAMIDAADDNDNDNSDITDDGDSNSNSSTSWSLTKTEQDAPLDIDEYGYIPYLNQTKNKICDLGFKGRCGQVMKIDFFGFEVALKVFQLQLDDDKRDRFNVFAHEREMYIRTKSLWGTHVPALIFHNPWPSCPSLGMQLGEPMEEDDIDNWSQGDRDKLEETLRKLEELGLKQTDRRGWNFVKLRKGDTEYVAVVDMESVVFIDGNGNGGVVNE